MHKYDTDMLEDVKNIKSKVLFIMQVWLTTVKHMKRYILYMLLAAIRDKNRSSWYMFPIFFFKTFVSMWNLGEFRENLSTCIVNNRLVKVQI